MPIADLVGSLASDRLHILVFGPGYGESVGAHIPGGGWLICDSLSKPRGSADFIPAAELLSSRDQQAALLVLTHPHDDHVRGFDRLVTRFATGRIGLVGIQMPEEGFTEGDDAAQIVAKSNRLKALGAISAYWTKHPELRWEMTADEQPIEFGDGTIEILHPTDEFIEGGIPDASKAPNDYSTPMLVCWEQARVVLGADLPNTQWTSVLKVARDAELSKHGALKVSHHGSREALPEELVRSGDRGAVAVLAPWQHGRGFLPKLGDKGGLVWLLARRSAVSLTSPGRALNTELPRPVTLAQYTDAVIRRPLPGGVGAVEIKHDYDPDESWVALTFTGSGDLEAAEFGRDACVIVEREMLSEPYPHR
jgi:hypothetical protein